MSGAVSARIGRLCLWLLVALFCGCAPPAERLLDDYLARVRRSTDADLDLRPVAVPRYPSVRDRGVPLIETQGSWLEILRFKPCGLGELIGERNSILARVAPASRRLDYELRFRAGLDRCAALLAGDAATDEGRADLRVRVHELQQAKAENVGPLWWWATYDSPAFAALFSIAREPLVPGDTAAFSQARLATETLLSVAPLLDSPPVDFDLAGLEQAYQQLELSGFGGRWLLSTAQLVTALDAASGALETAVDRRVCPMGRPNDRARILQTVFLKFYAAGVQPWLAELTQQGDIWLELQRRLLATQRVALPAAFETYRQQALGRDADSAWAHLANSRQRHIEAWQAVLRQCDLMPKAPVRPEAAASAPGF